MLTLKIKMTLLLCTWLHCNNSLEVAKLLIKKGADLNDKNKWGDTPLHDGCI